MDSERPTIPVPVDPMLAYRQAAKRNATSKPARGPQFPGCERPTVPVPTQKMNVAR